MESERVSNITPFINKYNWKGINYPSKIKDWKRSEKNNTTSFLNISYILKKREKCPACISKFNSNCEKQIIILININDEKESWHYLAVKKLSTLLHGITLKHKSGFYCLNCLHSFRTKNKLKSHEKVCKNKDFCGIVIPSIKDHYII